MMKMRIFYKIFRERGNQIPTVCNVELDRYLGKWYEIARFPHSFEKGLENVTATYSLKKNGKINVINSGFKNGARNVAKGIASIPNKNCTGRLLVSFFWPIKGEYRIIKLDEENYTFSVITSKNKKLFLDTVQRAPNER